MTAVEVERPRCVAHSSRTGERCKRSPIAGGSVCASHGGRAPQVKRAAARRLEAQRVEHELGRLLVDLEHDATEVSAIDVLLDSMRRAWSMVQVLSLVVGRLGDVDSLVAEDHLDDLRPRPEVGMLREWTTEAGRLAKLAIDAGVEERQVRILEEEGQLLVNVILGAVELVRGRLLDALAESEHRVVTGADVRGILGRRQVGQLALEAVQVAMRTPHERQAPVVDAEGREAGL